MKIKMIVLIITVVFIVVSTLSVFFLNSNYYYANKLEDAIKDENYEEIQSIIEKKPESINTYPSVAPKWWHSAMDMRVVYPLTLACQTDNLNIVKLLVESGADVNCNDGVTPLSMTYCEKNPNWYEISTYLIEKGASLNYTTDYSRGYSCVLQDICIKRYGGDVDADVYSAFVYAIGCIDTSNVDWVNVLQYGVSLDRIQIVELLLKQNYCDVNATTETGMTPLMFAARDSNSEMVKLLLACGANKTAQDNQGKIALDYARESGNQELIHLLSQ